MLGAATQCSSVAHRPWGASQEEDRLRAEQEAAEHKRIELERRQAEREQQYAQADSAMEEMVAAVSQVCPAGQSALVACAGQSALVACRRPLADTKPCSVAHCCQPDATMMRQLCDTDATLIPY